MRSNTNIKKTKDSSEKSGTLKCEKQIYFQMSDNLKISLVYKFIISDST